MELNYSFIIPVYNRPEELRELLQSMQELDFDKSFEVVVVEDGSTESSMEVIAHFSQNLQISYFQTPNTGPGDSRNYGMQRAKGNYFLILDSDVILPPHYLSEVDDALAQEFIHCFGGPDAAHPNFSQVQKAINYSMTSSFTTGGIRGKKQMLGKFQPRSFNMGISKKAFEVSGGFGKIHPGEDPDLALRLEELGFDSRLFPEAFVYHKRRIDWDKFYEQVYKFGLARPILTSWHPHTEKITYWFPAVFSLGMLLAVFLLIFKLNFLVYAYIAYFVFIFLDASIRNGNARIGVFSVWASLIQFLGYGLGFCRSTYYIRILKENPERRFPKLFFKNDQ
ncbi:MAG TPA: glycosyltransferase [Salinimicrobium sp.]|nr:glycosyltransferase [Salinimicrobium sp.]